MPILGHSYAYSLRCHAAWDYRLYDRSISEDVHCLPRIPSFPSSTHHHGGASGRYSGLSILRGNLHLYSLPLCISTPSSPWTSTASFTWKLPIHAFATGLANVHGMGKTIRWAPFILMRGYHNDIHEGELVYVEALGSRIIYVDNLEACRDLMEKRSAIYSDRPILTMASEL